MRAADESQVLAAAYSEALRVLATLDDARVPAPTARATDFGDLPSGGVGARAAFERLADEARQRANVSTGPRYFDYVVGGVTPAALGADWLTSALDQVASSALGSPLAVDLEEVVTAWVLQLVGIEPCEWTGTLVTGATMANFVSLGAARQWAGERLGVDVARDGLFGLPTIHVFASGFVHASVTKSLAMLGLGRRAMRTFSCDNRGSLDVPKLEAAIEQLDGAPFILVGTAGEVNSGRSDDLAYLARLRDAHGGWLHVDGAFGFFAGALDETKAQVRGIECADSIATDAHKWLNVPYDCGLAFVKDRSALAKTFRMNAAYLPPVVDPGERRRVPANLGPESSRRARAFPLFASLLAYGADGYRAMFRGHVTLAETLADRLKADPLFELVDEPALCIVPFRCAPPSLRKREYDDLNRAVAGRVAQDGRVSMSLTRYRSVVCFRPAIVNWRTGVRDIEMLLTVVGGALRAELEDIESGRAR